jgi:hypothetical protein
MGQIDASIIDTLSSDYDVFVDQFGTMKVAWPVPGAPVVANLQSLTCYVHKVCGKHFVLKEQWEAVEGCKFIGNLVIW